MAFILEKPAFSVTKEQCLSLSSLHSVPFGDEKKKLAFVSDCVSQEKKVFLRQNSR